MLKKTLNRLFPNMKKFNRQIAFFVLFLFVLNLFPVPQKVSGAWREPVRAKHGMVASQHELASKVGVEVLKKGGNAVDAAVALALALAVVYPEAGNLGGGGFAVIKRGDKLSTLDFREVAPAAATRDMYLDPKGEPVAEASQVGPL